MNQSKLSIDLFKLSLSHSWGPCVTFIYSSFKVQGQQIYTRTKTPQLQRLMEAMTQYFWISSFYTFMKLCKMCIKKLIMCPAALVPNLFALWPFVIYNSEKRTQRMVQSRVSFNGSKWKHKDIITLHALLTSPNVCQISCLYQSGWRKIQMNVLERIYVLCFHSDGPFIT